MTATDLDLPLLSNWIGGGPRPSDGATSLVIDPSTGEPVARAPHATPVDIDAAVAAATTAFPGWRDATPATRSRALARLADLLEERAGAFVEAEVATTGKPRRQVVEDELPSILDQLRFFAGAARGLEGRASGEYVAGHTSSVRREPVGVAAQVSPWNYPLMMAVWKVAPALAAGCSVVLKPAETTPATPLLLAELAAEVLPPGVLNVVCGDRETGRALVRHPGPAIVAITGSVRAGREVAADAGARLKRTHLELGGKAPVLVFDDVDLDRAVPLLLAAGVFNAGQSCTAATRVLATPGVHDRLVAALADAAGRMEVGLGDDAAFGALNNPDQLARVAGMVDRRAPSTEVIAGGSTLERPGFHYPATVIAGVEPGDELAREEIFGPVVTVERVADEDEALARANATSYGLAASVWTTSHARAQRLARALDFGTVWINCHSVLAAEMPHGGFGDSGHGKDLSGYALEDYTRVKHVVAALDG